MFNRSSKALIPVYLLFLILFFSCILIPVLSADLFWRTLGTEKLLTAVALLSAVLGYYLSRLVRELWFYSELRESDRFHYRLMVFLAPIIYSWAAILWLNVYFLQFLPYSQEALVTFKNQGKNSHYVAFKNSQYNSYGVLVNSSLYNSVETGSEIVIYLRDGLFGFPVVVDLSKK